MTGRRRLPRPSAIPLLVAGWLFTSAASAQVMAFHHVQVQLVPLVGMSLPDPAFGTAEFQVNASVASFGAALGVAFERFPGPDGRVFYGGVFHAALQWRFLGLADGDLYERFDPHIDLGFVLGGAGAGGDPYFRGAGYGGLGIDVALYHDDDGDQLAATVQYRWSPTGVHAPDTAPDHLLLFGLGYRIA